MFSLTVALSDQVHYATHTLTGVDCYHCYRHTIVELDNTSLFTQIHLFDAMQWYH